MIRQYSLISILIILLVGGVNDNQISQARIISEKLLNDISLGNTYNVFLRNASMLIKRIC